MRLQKSMVLAAVLGMSATHPGQVSAQFGIGARASTLGIGAEVSYQVNTRLGIRLGGNLFQLSRDVSIENIDYTLTPHLENATAIADLYPLGGAFHLSGGLLLNRNEGRMIARLNQDIVIGGQTYTPQEVGSLVGTVSFKKIAPYFGVGFGGRGRFAVLFDLGVGITGTPRVDLVGNTPLTGAAKAEFDANVQEELVEVRAEINGKSYLKFHPVVSLGLRIGF